MAPKFFTFAVLLVVLLDVKCGAGVLSEFVAGTLSHRGLHSVRNRGAFIGMQYLVGDVFAERELGWSQKP